MRIIFT